MIQRVRINNNIRASELRIVGADGANLGIMSVAEAVKKAQEENLDLIEISPNAKPPIAKIMDYGKFQYEQKKKQKEMKAKLLQDYKSTENRKITINGMQAQIIGGTFAEGVFNFRNIHLIIVENGQAYIVTGIALESTWDQYEDLFESSLLTFSLN